jgi:elongation factor 1-alpha
VDLASIPFRLQVSDSYSISGIGTVLIGVVRTGVLRVNDPISIQPVDITSRVTLIMKGRQEITEARPGDNITFAARGVNRDDIFSGVVCGPEDAPPTVALRFRATIEVLPPATDEDKTSDKMFIQVGDAFAFRYGSLHDICRLAAVDSVTRAGDSNPPEANATALKFGDLATVTLLPDVPLAIEIEAAFPGLGPFVMLDQGRITAYGTVVDLLSR